MTGSRASDVFVRCLEAEGVRHVFGIPGEETLDLNHSLDHSSIEFVPVRHEQAGAYMADVYGRLTGRAGVCLGTLGPGCAEPRHRGRRRVPRPRAARRAHRPARAGVDAQGVPPVRRPRRGHAPDHEVERARRARRRSSPRSCARRSASPSPRSPARRTSSCPRTSWPSRWRRPRCRAARRRCSSPPRASSPTRPSSSATRAAPSCSPATASCAPTPRRRCASSPAPPACRSPRRSWARARWTTPTRTRWAPSGCRSATTSWPASRTPTS